MYRGTTPTLRVRVTGVDVSELSGIYLAIRQGDAEITKGRDENLGNWRMFHHFG